MTYKDVQHDKAAMAEMTSLTRGGRDVPVLLEEGKVTIGYGGT